MEPRASGGKFISQSQRLIGERYELLECIGKGAHGRVFRGLDIKSQEPVAVKEVSLERLKQSDISSIMGEVELLKSLNHRNIVQYLGSFQTRQFLYIIMELVDSGSLAYMVKRCTLGPFPEALVGFFVEQILQGLDYLHSMGITHRDVKGANILINGDGLVKLADFGVAAKLSVEDRDEDDKEEDENGEDDGENKKEDKDGTVADGDDGELDRKVTHGENREKRDCSHDKHDRDAGSVRSHGKRDFKDATPAGTPYWMAPEVVELQEVTVASDIWSVGCVVIELLTGRPPYFDLQPLSAMYNIVQDPHPPLPTNMSNHLEDFLLQCFSKDPFKRPSARDLIKHFWIVESRKTMKSVWEDSSSEFDADVASVIDRLLASESASSPARGKNLGGDASNANECDGWIESNKRTATEDENENKLRKSRDALADETASSNGEFLVEVDRDPTGAAALSLMRGGRGNFRSVPADHGGEMGSSDSNDLLRQVESLRLVTSSKERSLVQEAAAAASARTIHGYISNDASLAMIFYHSDGLSCIREILDSQSERLVTPSFDLLLAVVDADIMLLEHACSLGIVPAAMRFALRNFPLDLRRRAARLSRVLVRGSGYSATMFVACQGIPFVMALMDGDCDDLELTWDAISVFWTILRRCMSGSGLNAWPNQYLRLMAHHDLPLKLVDALTRALGGPEHLKDASMFLEAAVNLFAVLCEGDKVVQARCTFAAERMRVAVIPNVPTEVKQTIVTAFQTLGLETSSLC